MQRPPSRRKVLARIAVASMSLAVVALGALALWGGTANQDDSGELSQAGVQTSGHLRAGQAPSTPDTFSYALEERIVPGEHATLL